MRITFATQPSTLARRLTSHVMRLLQAAHPGLECSEQMMTTEEDLVLDGSIPEIGCEDPISRDIEDALLSGKIQASVHSLKALPQKITPGLILGAIPEREAPYDVLVSADGTTHEFLPEGGRVGTNSVQRAAQILALRPDLKILPICGNAETHIQKLIKGDFEAIILSYAGLIRLGLQSAITETFPLNLMLPAPGQGALAVLCRADDAGTKELLAAIHHPPTASAVLAERAFLDGFGGGCALPVAAYAEASNGSIILTGAVISKDGKRSIRLSAVDDDPDRLGKRLAELVNERGAADLLKTSSNGS